MQGFHSRLACPQFVQRHGEHSFVAQGQEVPASIEQDSALRYPRNRVKSKVRLWGLLSLVQGTAGRARQLPTWSGAPIYFNHPAMESPRIFFFDCECGD